ncbi:hypothetical protein SKAU_G00404380 [Synaphobranchus kaupii]|uniref:Uncharacterized protein n=1 Tax=Synaphobranchus kaupii TaxID=118154 RepID=A0A9Q1ICN3_SYNKA|nr:hypothetical protein SKAU_G00404380 [Synaphobranchus kaupii]
MLFHVSCPRCVFSLFSGRFREDCDRSARRAALLPRGTARRSVFIPRSSAQMFRAYQCPRFTGYIHLLDYRKSDSHTENLTPAQTGRADARKGQKRREKKKAKENLSSRMQTSQTSFPPAETVQGQRSQVIVVSSVRTRVAMQQVLLTSARGLGMPQVMVSEALLLTGNEASDSGDNSDLTRSPSNAAHFQGDSRFSGFQESEDTIKIYNSLTVLP